MKCMLVLLVAMAITIGLTTSQRIYIRHKRSLEREGSPAKESTVTVVQGGNSNETGGSQPEASVGKPVDLPKDFENEIANSEKDCGKDFVEFDYNPFNDSLFFNGHIPSIHHMNRGVDSLEDMFHRTLGQAMQMFRRFPSMMEPFGAQMPNANYPDNYNGTVEEIVNIGGRQYKKKQHIINKTLPGTKFSVMSTVYEPVDDNSTTPANDTEQQNGTVKNDLTDGTIVSYK